MLTKKAASPEERDLKEQNYGDNSLSSDSLLAYTKSVNCLQDFAMRHEL